MKMLENKLFLQIMPLALSMLFTIVFFVILYLIIKKANKK